MKMNDSLSRVLRGSYWMVTEVWPWRMKRKQAVLMPLAEMLGNSNSPNSNEIKNLQSIDS